MRFRFCGDLDCPDWVLSEVATLSKLSSVRIKVVVNQILSFCLAGTFNYEKVLKLAADNAEGVDDMKGSIAAIHYMLTNAAKYDVDEQSLVQEIQQLGLPKENSENIGRAYREQKDSLRAKFAEESYAISRVVSTEWRVDQVIASSTGPIADYPIPVAHLMFGLDTCPQDGPITGVCNENKGDRIIEFACEISGPKLDVFVAELSRAQSILQTLQT